MSQNRLTTTGDRRTTTTGDVRVQAGTSEGELAQTFDVLTLSSAGLSDVVGAVSAAFDPLSLGSAGTLEVVGQASPTLSALTSAATGTVDLVGAAAGTLDPLTLVSATGVEVQGVSASTLGELTLASAGLVSDAVILGDLDQALAPLTLAGAYTGAVFADGATFYMPLNETSGLAAVDRVGGQVGVISGGVTLGQSGALSDGDLSMLFDGSTGHIAVPDGAYQAFGTGPMSVEFWFKTTASSNDYVIDNKVGGTTAKGFGAQASIGALGCLFRISNGTTIALVQAPGSYGDGLWHYFACTLLRGVNDVLSLYIDGGLVATTTVPATAWDITPVSGRALRIGTYADDGAQSENHYDGNIDEVALYGVALTAEQIATHYALRLAHGTAGVSGAVASTLAEMSSVVSGYLDALTVVSEATVAMVGSLDVTLDAMAIQADGVLPVTGAAAIALRPLTTAAWAQESDWLQLDWVGQVDAVSGSVEVAGVLVATLDDAVLVSNGTVVNPGEIIGDLNQALEALSLVSAGVVEAAEIIGDLDATLETLTMSAAVTVDVTGDVSVTFAPLVVVMFSAFQPVARPGDRYTTSIGASSTTTTLASSATSAEFQEAA